MTETLLNNESTAQRIKRDIKSGLGGLFALWNQIPRGIQYGIASAALIFAQRKFPGVIPAETTPNEILAGAGVLAGLHHLEDRAETPKP